MILYQHFATSPVFSIIAAPELLTTPAAVLGPVLQR
jgi:hypothetical protein